METFVATMDIDGRLSNHPTSPPVWTGMDPVNFVTVSASSTMNLSVVVMGLYFVSIKKRFWSNIWLFGKTYRVMGIGTPIVRVASY
jgi:hypothetical protein